MNKTTYDKPYLLRDVYAPNSHILVYKWRERKTDRFIFYNGKWVEPQDFDLIFHANTTKEKILNYDCAPNNAAVILANERALEILNEICPDDFQAFDVTIVNDESITPGFEISAYKLINIVKLIDALDIEKSEGKYVNDGVLYGVKRKILKEDCMGENHLVRDQNIEGIILASATLKSAFEKAKIRGLKFMKDDSV